MGKRNNKKNKDAGQAAKPETAKPEAAKAEPARPVPAEPAKPEPAAPHDREDDNVKVYVHSTTGGPYRRAGIVFGVEPVELTVLPEGKKSQKDGQITVEQYELIKGSAGLNRIGQRGALAISGDDEFTSALKKAKAAAKKKAEREAEADKKARESTRR